MKINVSHNIKEFNKDLKRFARVDIPDINRIALNETATKVKELEQTAMRKYLDRPTKQTVNSLFIIWARKNKLRSILTFRDWAQEYLKFQIEGGIRKKNRTAVPLRETKLNHFGNIPGRKSGLLKSKNTFIDKINGVHGIWQNTKKGLKLLYPLIDNPRYKSIFPFYRIARKAAITFLPLKFNKVATYYIKKAGYKTK